MIKHVLIVLLFLSTFTIQAQHVLNFIIPPCPYVNATKPKVIKEMDIYPNPATENFDLQFFNSENTDVATVKIFNILGKSVFKKDLLIQKQNNALNIKISHFEKGTYIVKLILGDKIHHRKLIIE